MTEQTQIQPQIIVRTQYVKDLSFENPDAPKALMSQEKQPEIQLNINVTANPQSEERVFEIVLAITANAKRDDETVFIAELAYAAVIAIDESIEDRFLHPLVMIEGPRIVFPFARQVLSNITQAGGFMPLNVQPIDFARIYQAGIENQARNAKANGAETPSAETPSTETPSAKTPRAKTPSASDAANGVEASEPEATDRAKKN